MSTKNINNDKIVLFIGNHYIVLRISDMIQFWQRSLLIMSAVIFISSCSDENKVPDLSDNLTNNTQQSSEKKLPVFSESDSKLELEKKLNLQVAPDLIKSVTVNSITVNEENSTETELIAIVNTTFTSLDDEKETFNFSAELVNGQWTINCNVESCSIYATPKSIVKALVYSMVDNNIPQFISTMNIQDSYTKKRLQQQLAISLPKIQEQIIKNEGIKSIGFYNIMYNEDRTKATVPLSIIYNNGNEEKQSYHIEKIGVRWFAVCNLSSCLINSSPEAITQEFMRAFITGDAERFVNSLYITDPYKKEAFIKQSSAMLDKSKKMIEAQGGVKNIFIEDIIYTEDDHSLALIFTKIVFKNGQEEKQTYEAIHSNGRWYINLNL